MEARTPWKQARNVRLGAQEDAHSMASVTNAEGHKRTRITGMAEEVKVIPGMLFESSIFREKGITL